MHFFIVSKTKRIKNQDWVKLILHINNNGDYVHIFFSTITVKKTRFKESTKILY